QLVRNQPTRQINPHGAASCRTTEAPRETSSYLHPPTRGGGLLDSFGNLWLGLLLVLGIGFGSMVVLLMVSFFLPVGVVAWVVRAVMICRNKADRIFPQVDTMGNTFVQWSMWITPPYLLAIDSYVLWFMPGIVVGVLGILTGSGFVFWKWRTHRR
ncbi:hypothetical protein ABZ871_40545, partial [Streptomyces populi]